MVLILLPVKTMVMIILSIGIKLPATSMQNLLVRIKIKLQK